MFYYLFVPLLLRSCALATLGSPGHLHQWAIRVAVVTGGNRGIGLEICRQLASNGVLVVLTARDDEKGSQAVEDLHKSSLTGVIFHRLDVADRSSIVQLAEFVKAKFRKLDILVSEFSVCFCGAFSLRGFRFTVSVHLPGQQCRHWWNNHRSFRISQFMSNEAVIEVLSDVDNLSEEKLNDVSTVFLRDFQEGNLAARGWLPVVSAYAASKALLNAYSRLLARRHPSLVVCCVNPGFVRTAMNYGMGVLSAAEAATAPVALALRHDRADSGLNFELCSVCEF